MACGLHYCYGNKPDIYLAKINIQGGQNKKYLIHKKIIGGNDIWHVVDTIYKEENLIYHEQKKYKGWTH